MSDRLPVGSACFNLLCNCPWVRVVPTGTIVSEGICVAVLVSAAEHDQLLIESEVWGYEGEPVRHCIGDTIAPTNRSQTGILVSGRTESGVLLADGSIMMEQVMIPDFASLFSVTMPTWLRKANNRNPNTDGCDFVLGHS